MFRFRMVGFVLLLGILGGIFFWEAGGFWLFMAVAPALCAAAVGECCLMLDRSGRSALPLPAALLSWLVMVTMLLTCRYPGWKPVAASMLTTLIFLVTVGALAGMLAMRPKFMEALFTSLGVTGLLTLPLLMFLMTELVEPAGYWLLFLCLVTKATDTGGYIVGMLTAKLPGGNHKIAKVISPKKSWEGLAGGFLLSLAVAWAFSRFGKVEMPLTWALFVGAVLSIGSFFGDLSESALKRMCGVKDSGGFVPGMGGAFDVLDSFLYNGMLFWWLYGMRVWFL